MKILVEIIDDGPCAHIDNPFIGIIYGRTVESLKNLLEDSQRIGYNMIDTSIRNKQQTESGLVHVQ